jgi:hypothetical protein
MPRGKAAGTLKLIDKMVEILREIQPTSVRSVCYQLFIRKLIPSMAKTVTNGVGKQLVYARENRIIPCEWISDEGREVERQPAWDDPEDFKAMALYAYRRERWTTQPVQIEVWSEKGTVRGTLAPVLKKYGVPFRVMHGYTSFTVIDEVIQMQIDSEKPLHALYVGDHDCSGLHMSHVDLPNRLRRRWEALGDPTKFNITIIHLALTTEDCKSLPSYPAKKSDKRFKWYVETYGRRAWELDAIRPPVLRNRVERSIRKLINWEAWQRMEACEQAEQRSLETVLTQWAGLKHFDASNEIQK